MMKRNSWRTKSIERENKINTEKLIHLITKIDYYNKLLLTFLKSAGKYFPQPQSEKNYLIINYHSFKCNHYSLPLLDDVSIIQLNLSLLPTSALQKYFNSTLPFNDP